MPPSRCRGRTDKVQSAVVTDGVVPYWEQSLTEENCPYRTFGSWLEFVAASSVLAETGIQFAFRGEADHKWRLTPTLLRRAPYKASRDLLVAEREAMRAFMAQAHLHLSSEHLPEKGEPEFELEWWALMQHFGAPTRLLDWTLSPFVAAYFAVEQLPESDGVVSVVNASAVQMGLNDNFRKFGAGVVDVRPRMFQADAPDLGVFFWDQDRRRSARSVAQQGLLSVTSNVANQHGKIFDIATKLTQPPTYDMLRSRGMSPAERWIFPASIKAHILSNLRSANIAAHSIFPGLDGVGRSVTEIIRIGSARMSDRLRYSDLESPSDGTK